MKIGSLIFVAAITVTLLMALTMNLLSAESDAKVRANPSGEQKVNLEQEQHNVELNFTVPRALPVERAYNELGYDDGWELSGHAWGCAGSGYAVRFTPPSYPVELQTARINFWPNWPNIYHETFAIYVYAGDSRGRQPDTYLGGPVYHTATNWYWNDVDISGLHITIERGDFYILYLQLSGYPDCEALSFDRGQPYYGRSWEYSGGSWSTSPLAYNYMIRCVVKNQENDIGVFRNGQWILSAGYRFNFGNPSDIPVTGDWDSDGEDTIGVYRNGQWILRNSNSAGTADYRFNFGNPSDIPVTGDWNGDGEDTIGVYRNGQWILRDSNSAGGADYRFNFGNPTDIPVTGDWNGDGESSIGVYRNGEWILRNSNSAGGASYRFDFGNPTDKPVTGDWDGNDESTIGVYRNGQWILRNINSAGSADYRFNYGNPTDKPVTGDWDDDGESTIGVYRNGEWILRDSNSAGGADYRFSYGNPTDKPVTGDWDGM